MTESKHLPSKRPDNSDPLPNSKSAIASVGVGQVDCLIAFGANLGDADSTYGTVEQSLNRIDGFSDVRSSSLITTEPIGGPADQNAYQNGAILLRTTLTASECHRALVRIEQDQGRVKRERWGSRNVDLDLLLFGNQIVNEAMLTIPHPRMSFRRFVLEPAYEVAPKMIHPVCGLSIAQLLDRINGTDRTIEWLVGHGTHEESGSDPSEPKAQAWRRMRLATVQRFPNLEFQIREPQSDVENRSLLVIVEDDRVLPQVQSPFLNLAHISVERAEQEVAAAIAAIAPL